MPQELEKHLILNSNRFRTFEDARLEVVTYVEAKFGLRVRDSKPSDTGARGQSDPMDVDAVNSLSLSSSKGKRVIKFARWVFYVRWCSFSTRLQCTQGHRQAIVWQRQTKQVMSKSEPSYSGKGKGEENKGKSKGKSKRNQKCEPRCPRRTQR